MNKKTIIRTRNMLHMDFSARLIRRREFICNVIPGAFGILGGAYE